MKPVADIPHWAQIPRWENGGCSTMLFKVFMQFLQTLKRRKRALGLLLSHGLKAHAECRAWAQVLFVLFQAWTGS